MSHVTRERRGAHRPAGLGPAGTIPWLVAAVAIVAIVVYASGWWGGTSASPGSNTVTAGPSSSGAKPSATRTASSSPTSTATGSGAATGTSSPAASADRTQRLEVLNGTKRSGLAKAAASALSSAGWSIGSTGNYRGATVPTTVFYASPDLLATAKAVVADLGAPAALQESSVFGASRVTVVLGADYPG